MTDPTARQGAATDVGETTPEAHPPELVPAEQVTAALGAAAEFKDKLLRTLAEMENLRKRTEREVADARQYAIANFSRDVLAVADNMHRALEAIDSELRDSADTKMKSLVEGVELTERELMKVLERNGVKMFSPAGEKFDPNLHQAMYEIETPELPAGHVAQVIQAGYMLGERVLRPAMVAVSKSGPKSQASAKDHSGDAA
ncbi:MAG TPA: nucleotide exchange factor GrpE [Pseudolabrys sp.]|jgi:molecular chaperone GrpE|nr:nucleotide exchange factor GrpE [Pseudolabrys sp.]